MNLEAIKSLLSARLRTLDEVQEYAKKLEVSQATLYRWKANPGIIPFEKVMAITALLGVPIDNDAVWGKAKIVEGEKRRYELERALATGGIRYTITPSYTVTTEIEELTRRLWDFDYGTKKQELVDQYISWRSKRRDLYFSGAYTSFEIINGRSYLDFFAGTGRFRAIPKLLREKQIVELKKTLTMRHISRRIYLSTTPELPVFSCFSNGVAIIRVDDFTVEFSNQNSVNDLQGIFNDYYDAAEVKGVEEVQQFLLEPHTFLK